MNRQITLNHRVRMKSLTPGLVRWSSLVCAATMAALMTSNPAAADPPGPVNVNVVSPSPLPVTVNGGVSNPDEPGRQPYVASLAFSQYGCFSLQCANFVKQGSAVLFDGPEVPAGKRLVIKYVSGYLPNADTASLAVGLQSEQILTLSEVIWSFFGPFYALKGPVIGFSSQAFATYGPGERPHVHVVAPAINDFVGLVSLSGYLIDAQ